MNKKELAQVLEQHRKWLYKESDGTRADLSRANLRYADLSGADLSRAKLRYANLRYANLSRADLSRADLNRADLSGADIDYSCWPLWCGSKDVKVDARIATQLAAHFCVLDCDDPAYQKAREEILKFAKTSHRAKDIGLVEEGTK